jgi:hypothetical protein
VVSEQIFEQRQLDRLEQVGVDAVLAAPFYSLHVPMPGDGDEQGGYPAG